MPSRFTIAPGADSEAQAVVLDRLEADASRDNLPPSTVDRIVLVAGELVSNAAEHGDEVVTFWWGSSAEGGHLCVSPGPGELAVRSAVLPHAEAVRGRGLFLVHELGDGVTGDAETLRVRFFRRKEE